MRNMLLFAGLMSFGVLSADEALASCNGRNLDQRMVSKNRHSKQRLHPTKHFESFSEITFEEELGGHAQKIANSRYRSPSSIGRHRGGGIADSYNEVKDQLNVNGANVHAQPVTNKEYYQFIKSTGYPAPKHWKNDHYPNGKADEPVTNVSYHDAKNYAKWANKRLPTRDELMEAAKLFPLQMDAAKTEWTSTLSGMSTGGSKQVIVDDSGQESTMSPFNVHPETGFRVVSPNGASRDAFRTPEGNIIRPDQDLETPEGDPIIPSGNPSDFDQ